MASSPGGLYFVWRYHLGEVGIGLALLGYGVPGFLFGPLIGRAADRWGRRWLVPAGVGIAGVAGLFLIRDLPVVMAALVVTMVSLGYDVTQPLFAGIVTALGGPRGGQAMGLNVFTLFIGFGIGSLLFGEAWRWASTRPWRSLVSFSWRCPHRDSAVRVRNYSSRRARKDGARSVPSASVTT